DQKLKISPQFQQAVSELEAMNAIPSSQFVLRLLPSPSPRSDCSRQYQRRLLQPMNAEWAGRACGRIRLSLLPVGLGLSSAPTELLGVAQPQWADRSFRRCRKSRVRCGGWHLKHRQCWLGSRWRPPKPDSAEIL